MRTDLAFMMGAAHRNDPARVFDWIKAAHMIRAARPNRAGAGLQSDWEWTGGDIFRNGAPVPKDETYTYLASVWAIPEISIDGEVEECWVWLADSPGWDEHTYWPQEALDVLYVDGAVVTNEIEGPKMLEIEAS